jgi:hypothetical protein
MAQNLSIYAALRAMQAGIGKPVLYISFSQPDPCDAAFDGWMRGLRSAAPYLFEGEICKYPQILQDWGGFLVCEDEEELRHLYDQTVGDDTIVPGEVGRHDGPVCVYALTSLGNENT